MVGDDGASDLDDGKLLRGHGCEVRQVLLHLALGADVAEQLDDRRSGRQMWAMILYGRVQPRRTGGIPRQWRRASPSRTPERRAAAPLAKLGRPGACRKRSVVDSGAAHRCCWNRRCREDLGLLQDPKTDR